MKQKKTKTWKNRIWENIIEKITEQVPPKHGPHKILEKKIIFWNPYNKLNAQHFGTQINFTNAYNFKHATLIWVYIKQNILYHKLGYVKIVLVQYTNKSNGVFPRNV
jgi:hypothetical protein